MTERKCLKKLKENSFFVFSRHQDKHNQAFSLCLGSVRWMGVRVDFLSVLFIGAVAFSTILISQDAGNAVFY